MFSLLLALKLSQPDTQAADPIVPGRLPTWFLLLRSSSATVTAPSLPSAYRIQASWIWRKLFRQEMPCALALALARAGSSSAARMAIMAITTSNSMSVNALEDERLVFTPQNRFVGRLLVWPSARNTNFLVPFYWVILIRRCRSLTQKPF